MTCQQLRALSRPKCGQAGPAIPQRHGRDSAKCNASHGLIAARRDSAPGPDRGAAARCNVFCGLNSTATKRVLGINPGLRYCCAISLS